MSKIQNMLNKIQIDDSADCNFLQKIILFMSSECAACIFCCCYLLLGFLGYDYITTGIKPVTLFSQLIKVFGFIIIFCSIFNKKIWRFDFRFCILMLFIVSHVISAFFGWKYGGIFNSLKSVIWLILQFFVVYNLFTSGINSKWLNRFLYFYIFISTIHALLSLLMAAVGYYYAPTFIGNDIFFGGMCWGRLFGMFEDANYSGINAALTIYAVLFLAFRDKNKAKIVVPMILIIIHLFYMSLSGSRTTILSLVITFFIISFVILRRCNILDKAKDKIKNNKNNFVCNVRRLFLSFGICVLLVFSVLACSYIYESVEPVILKSIDGPVIDPQNIFPENFADEVRASCEIREPYLDSGLKTSHVGLLGRDEGEDLSNQRFSLWKGAIQVWKSSPIFGVSYNAIPNYTGEKFPDDFIGKTKPKSFHNVFLDVLGSQGLVGIVLWVAFLFLSLFYGFRYLSRVKGIEMFRLSVLLAIVIHMIVTSCFYPELIYCNTVGSVIFWVVLGVIRKEELNKTEVKSIFELKRKS